jgi:hypothetical protein
LFQAIAQLNKDDEQTHPERLIKKAVERRVDQMRFARSRMRAHCYIERFPESLDSEAAETSRLRTFIEKTMRWKPSDMQKVKKQTCIIIHNIIIIIPKYVDFLS